MEHCKNSGGSEDGDHGSITIQRRLDEAAVYNFFNDRNQYCHDDYTHRDDVCGRTLKVERRYDSRMRTAVAVDAKGNAGDELAPPGKTQEDAESDCAEYKTSPNICDA